MVTSIFRPGKKWHLSLTFVFLVLGLLLSTSFYARQRSQAAASPRKQDLIQAVRGLEKDRERLKRRVAGLRVKVEDYGKRAAAETGAAASFNAQLDRGQSQAGLMAARGPGLVITIGDNPQFPKGEDPNSYVIHDYDLRVIVNALWAAGAEAISVNEQRLVSTSAVRCAGNTVLVNTVRLASPYVIKAVGQPERLRKGLAGDAEADRFLTSVASTFGLQVDIAEKGRVRVPAYRGSVLIRNAKVLEGTR